MPCLAPQDPAGRLGALERAMAPQRRKARMWRAGTLALVVAALVTGGFAFAAVETTVREWKAVHGEMNKYDTTKFSFGQASTGLAAAAYSAQATTPAAAAEVAPILAVASTAVAQNDWFYEVDVQEVGAALLASGTYKAVLTVNGVDQGALYFKQGTALPLAVEGVTLRWALGPNLASAATYVVRITSV